jgi:hypothetical protein
MTDHVWTEQEDIAFRTAAGELPAPESERAPLRVVADGELPWPVLHTRQLPPFPVDALPAAMAAWVQAVAIESQTPVDLAALAALGVLSGAAMGSAVVDCGSWTEELTLYLLTVLPPAERKSTVLKAALAPLQALEREARDTAAPTIRAQQTRKDVLDRRKSTLTKQVADQSDPDERREVEGELTAVDDELAAIGEPTPPRILADDATPEALARLLDRHASLAVISAESAVLDNLNGRYSEGSANLHLVCKAYNGEHTVVDRAKGDALTLDRPLLTIAIAAQPHVLQALVSHPAARAQGLVSRFAYAMPTTAVGSRQIYDVPSVPEHVREGWATLVSRAYANRETYDTNDKTPGFGGLAPGSVISVMGSGGVTLTLSDPAKRLLDDLRAQLEPRLGAKGDLHHIGEWVGRMHGRVARIAGLLHLAESTDTEIAAPTMLAALAIGDYLLEHSIEALTGADPLTRKATDWLRARGEATVTQRDLQRGPAQGKPVEAAAALADALDRAGVIRPMPPAESGKPGRPASPTYEVHPSVAGTAA